MSNSKHTPGPWRVSKVWNGFVILSASGYVITFINAILAYKKQQLANARLIAAAPEMLASLKTALAVIHPDTDEAAQVRAAIAKATGD